MAVRLRFRDLAPEGYAALTGFGHYVNTGTALEPVLLGLVYLRASLLNGCGFCIGMHTAELRKLHEPQSRIDAVAEGAASDAFTPREQAALAWTDVMTRLDGSHASEEDYAAVTAFFHDKDVVDLTYAIAAINAWNRMSIAFAGRWEPAKSASGGDPAVVANGVMGAGAGTQGEEAPSGNGVSSASGKDAQG